MDEPKAKIEMTIELDLLPPGTEESRDQFWKRCLITLNDIGIIVAVGAATGRLRADIQTYLDSAERFLEPSIPPEFVALMTEWQSLPHEPAA